MGIMGGVCGRLALNPTGVKLPKESGDGHFL